MSARAAILLTTVVLLFLLSPQQQATAAPDITELLSTGKLRQAEQQLTKHLQTDSQDDLARFQLGTIQLLRAAETLTQDGARYGATGDFLLINFLRLGAFTNNNKDPDPITYQDIRAMIQRFQLSVAKAEQTLALIQADDLYWSLDFRQVAIDFNGDGQYRKSENLAHLLRLAARTRRTGQDNQPLTVGLDSADIYWLRGYCHVLQALADMTLAYDHQELFDATAHAFFADPHTEFARRRDKTKKPAKNSARMLWRGWENFADIIASIHLMDFPLIEPQRMASAREHLLKMVELSRKNWELVLQETDNRNELIPNPQQTSIIPNMMVNQQRIDAWQQFLAEAQAILNGEKLLPFWRSGFPGGINLHRVFTEPLDLVLWLQGSAAFPYLEEGQVTDPQLWREFQRLFGGNFLGFALWVN